MLKTEYNVEIVFQVPRLPYTNLLDLGVWCSLQSEVEKEHRLKNNDIPTLATSVKDTWENCDRLHGVIHRVWGRLRNVLVLIKEGDGGNHKVETKRGRQYRNLDMPAETPAATGTNNNTADRFHLDDDHDNIDDDLLDLGLDIEIFENMARF